MNLKEYIGRLYDYGYLGQPSLPEGCRWNHARSNFTESRDIAGAAYTPCSCT